MQQNRCWRSVSALYLLCLHLRMYVRHLSVSYFLYFHSQILSKLPCKINAITHSAYQIFSSGKVCNKVILFENSRDYCDSANYPYMVKGQPRARCISVQELRNSSGWRISLNVSSGPVGAPGWMLLFALSIRLELPLVSVT